MAKIEERLHGKVRSKITLSKITYQLFHIFSFSHDFGFSFRLLGVLCYLVDSLDLIPIAGFHSKGKRTGN